MTEQQKILLFYALEALERTLTTDEDGDIYFRQSEYYPDKHEFAKLGNEDKLRDLIDKTLNDLC